MRELNQCQRGRIGRARQRSRRRHPGPRSRADRDFGGDIGGDIQTVQGSVVVPQVLLVDNIVDAPVQTHRHDRVTDVPAQSLKAQNAAEAPQVQFIDRVADFPADSEDS